LWLLLLLLLLLPCLRLVVVLRAGVLGFVGCCAVAEACR
jgi:hypothetical protein